MSCTLRSAAFVVALCAASTCARAPSPPSADRRARELADLAPTPEQERLWREAARAGAAPGLERLPVPNLKGRGRQSISPGATAIPPQPVDIPQGVNAIRIVEYPIDVSDYTGLAEVVQAIGPRVELNLGQNRVLAIVARVDGQPLTVNAKEQVRIDYRLTDFPRGSRRIVAVRTPRGDGVLTIADGGDKPVSATVPLLNFTARQVGAPSNGVMNVEVTVDKNVATVTPGAIVRLPGFTVGLLASTAHNPDEPRLEGNRYSFELIGWTTKAKP